MKNIFILEWYAMSKQDKFLNQYARFAGNFTS